MHTPDTPSPIAASTTIKARPPRRPARTQPAPAAAIKATSPTPTSTIGPTPNRPTDVRASVSGGNSQCAGQRSKVRAYWGREAATTIAGSHAKAIIAAARPGEGSDRAWTAGSVGATDIEAPLVD